MYAIFMYMLPLLILVLLNTFIYKEVREMRRRREELSRQIHYFQNMKDLLMKYFPRKQSAELGLTMMLVAVVTVFVMVVSVVDVAGIRSQIRSVLEVGSTLTRKPLRHFMCARHFSISAVR